MLFECRSAAPAPGPDAFREATIAVLALVAGGLITMILTILFGPSSATKSEPEMVTPSPAPVLQRSGTVKSMVTDVAPAQLQRLMESRRSVMPKNMTGKPVPEEKVAAILNAAPWAPNHGKTEPWRFVVFAGVAKEKLLQMTLEWYCSQPAAFWMENFLLASGKPEFPDSAAFSAYYEKAAVDKWGRASHLVAICVRRQRPESGKKQHPEWEETCAVACAVQNMHLLATSLQVGAYWSSWYAHYRAASECTRDLGFDSAAGDRCLGVFVIGEMDANLSNRAARLPLEEFTTFQA